MKFILHIGQSKTGTSSLQFFLAQNRQKLADNFSICYPDYFRKGLSLKTKDHNSFADSLTGTMRYPRFEPNDYFYQFIEQAEKNKCETILLSGESFFGGAPQAWEVSSSEFETIYQSKLHKLQSLLSNHSIEVIVYLRRQDLWLESIISHIIRWEGLSKNKIYKSDRQIYKLMAPRLNYSQALELWEEMLSPFSVTVIPYEKEKWVGNNTVSDFLHRLKIDNLSFALFKQTPLENVSLSQEMVELKKILNQTPKAKAKEEAVINVLNQINHKRGSGINYQISSDLRSQILEDFEDCNKKLSQRYSSNINESFFAPVEKEKIKEVSSAEITQLAKVFYAEYRRPQIKVFIAKRVLARFLRNHFPYLHALCKNILLFSSKRKQY